MSGGGFSPPAVTGISPNKGPAAGGTVVTITGTSLAGATAVMFGTTAAASFAIVNATTITATSPAGTGTVDIAVTAPAGTSAPTAASKFTYASTTSATTIASSLNPSEVGQAVTFTATVAGGSGTPTGVITFSDGGTVIGTATLVGGTASVTTASLARGTHSITASYGGSTGSAPSTSPILVQTVNVPADSVRLRALQVGATQLVAQGSGQAISGAIDGAIAEGFGDGGQLISPIGNGLHFNFAAEASSIRGGDEVDGSAEVRQAGLGDTSDPINPVTAFAAEERPRARVGDAFTAFDRRMPIKAPTLVPGQPRDWILWANISGFGLDRWQQGAPLTGDQLNALLGLTRKVSPTFIIGVFGGYETFSYASQPYNGRLTGDGWTVGPYLGWKFMPGLRFDLGAAYSGLGYDGTSGAATGSFNGNRWLLSGGLTGTTLAHGLSIEPSAKVYVLWERENAYTDSLGTLQAERTFVTGRASGGVKVAYPWLYSSVLTLMPYAGLYGDYYFTGDDAANLWDPQPLASFPLLDGWSARATGGLSVSFTNGARIVLGGIGNDTVLWTYRARAQVPF